MIDFERIKLLEAEILDSEARKIFYRMKAITLPYKVFEGNYHQLNLLLKNLIRPEVFFMWAGTENRKEREAVILEIARCFYNYVMSAMTLVDHTRKFKDKYDANSELVIAYNERIKNDFVDQGLPQFIRGLRNHATPLYCLFHSKIFTHIAPV